MSRVSFLSKQFSQLPRESQDALFLIGVISCVLVPHFSHLPSWAPIYTLVLLAWRALLAWRGRTMPHRAWLMLLLAIAVGGTWWSFRTLVGKDAGVTLIVILLALKTLEAKAKRDAYFFAC
jgi:cation transport ATPase